MKKNGFTLIELVVVIAILGLLVGLVSTNVLKSGEKAKERLLNSKIKNLEKAAVLLGQDYEHDDDIRENLGSGDKTLREYLDDSKLIEGISCGDLENASDCMSITVNTLAKTKYMDYDDKEKSKFTNPINDSSMNDCEITIYKKYGKIYATYDKTVSGCFK